MKGLCEVNIKIPVNVAVILSILETAKFEAYIVGGCVRDSIMKLQPHDWDICTNATPQQSKQCFIDNGLKIIETGMKHGTITAVLNKESYEVTTYRVDGEYLDNRHPTEVQFVNSLKEDLARRDFTINAMAYNATSGLVDYFNGQDDINNRVIRCVGKPDDRFQEDALRIMRALRFASTYGFSVADDTSSSIRDNKELLLNIASERLNVELCKLLYGDGVELIFNKYPDVVGVFIPEILPMVGFQQHNPHHIYDVWMHTVKAVANCPPDPVIKLSMLFHDIGKPRCFTLDEYGTGHFYGHGKHSVDMSVEIMKRLKFDNSTIEQVRELILYHDADIQSRNKRVKRWLNKIGEDRLRQLIQVKTADVLAQSDLDREIRLLELQNVATCIDEVIQQRQCFNLKDLAVNGRDLMEAGVLEGIQIGIVLNRLMDMVLDEQIENDREDLLNAVKSL